MRHITPIIPIPPIPPPPRYRPTACCRRAVVTRATDRLAQACTEAVANLVDVMANSGSDGSRVSASKAVIDYAYKAIELEDLAARIERLEEALNETK